MKRAVVVFLLFSTSTIFAELVPEQALGFYKFDQYQRIEIKRTSQGDFIIIPEQGAMELTEARGKKFRIVKNNSYIRFLFNDENEVTHLEYLSMGKRAFKRITVEDLKNMSPNCRERVSRMPIVRCLQVQLSVPGLAVVFFENGEPTQSVSLGVENQDTYSNITSGTLFQAAQLTWPVSAAITLMLNEEKRISIDAPLGTMGLPAEKMQQVKNVSLRKILNLTYPLPKVPLRGYHRTAELPTLDQVILGQSPANNSPLIRRARTSEPANLAAYTLLQKFLEVKVPNESFGDLTIPYLRKLGFARSLYALNPPSDFFAYGHDANGELFPAGYNLFPELAAGGLWASPQDYAQFIKQIYLSFHDRGDSALTRGQILTLITATSGDNALGFTRKGNLITVSGCSIGFCNAMDFNIQTGNGFLIMTNGDRGLELAERLREQLYSDLPYQKNDTY
jgi:CubicO group peptidase (beta-lactamase class C family)